MDNADDTDRLKRYVQSIINDLENPPPVNDDGEDVRELDNYVQDDDGEWITDFECTGIDPLTDGRVILDNAHGTLKFYDVGPFEPFDPDEIEPDEYVIGHDAWWSAEGRKLILGGSVDDDVHPQQGYDYLSDVLDIEYIVSAAGDYIGARVLVACGGPNIWINTRNNTVEGHWWGDSYTDRFTDSIGLDDACRELWECR